jgi:type III pantothenate kinase
MDEYAMLLNTVCMQKRIDTADVEGCVISSVVPPLTEPIRQAVEEVFSCKPLVITHGVKTGLNIRIDNQTQLGSDIVANTVAAASVLQKPFAVIDLGTATTISAVNASGELIGVIIVPGTRLAVDALSASAAELPHISLTAPRVLVGKNTKDSMLSGSIYGTAAMLDGIIGRLKEELAAENLSVIACGGLADKIVPFCHTEIPINPYLTLDGLLQLYRLNQRKPKCV